MLKLVCIFLFNNRFMFLEVIAINRKRKKDRNNKFVELINNNIIPIMIIVFALVVLMPVVVWIMFEFSCFKSSISADGLLGYFGATISSFIALFVAFIGIYKSKKSDDLQEDLQIDSRRKQIRPILHPFLCYENDNCYLLIENLSSYAAFSPVLFDKDIANFITSNNPIKIKVDFTNNSQDPDVYVFDESFYELNEDGYPCELIFVYGDVDNNILTEKFKLVSTDLGLKYRAIQDVEYD